jgi:hypothetical protein
MYRVRFKGLPGINSGYGDAICYFCLSFYYSNLDVFYDFEPNDHYDLKVKKKVESIYPEMKNIKRFYKGNDVDISFYIGTPKLPDRGTDYNISYFYWETDSLPSKWIPIIHQYDEIWTPCNLVKEAVIKAGFKKPVIVVPTPNLNYSNISKVQIPHLAKKDKVLSKDTFKFYYIFQWQYRKGYDVLIKAYFDAFTKNENVILILKTNKLSGSQDEFLSKIKKEVKRFKKERLNCPEIYVIPNFISSDEIAALHKYCDAYVAPNRGEGWGMPIVAAAKEENLIITTKFGGAAEFLDEKSAMFVSHKLTPVKNMSWSGHLYTANQKWVEPSVADLSRIMRDSYYKKKRNLSYGKSAKIIFDNFNIKKMSKVINDIFKNNRFKK